MYRNADNWVLHADVYGSEDKFDVFVEVPGICLEDIELEVTPQTVRVWGIKKAPIQDATALAIEIQTGDFFREIHLPGRVDTTEVFAELTAGTLHITLRREKPVRVSIPVQS